MLLPVTIETPNVAPDQPASEALRLVLPTLDTLAPGTRGVVEAPDGLSPVVLRLLEMGLTPGTEVAVTRRALGADPIEIQLRGTRICLRRADAARFPVRVSPQALP